ncbi:MAG TPA: hypothetical protein DCX89_06675 [Saprospirales bacterium]|nr:hypothetical protein [Saprospirales bacterium]HRQ29956.1 hypothetical protein [Saprospiraceae bacterium]
MNHLSGKIMLLLMAFCFAHPVITQKALSKEQANALNEYVRFANESVHGMLIAHRLFENYNQDINKFVDLPGHQLNFYSNSDLPANIFEDPENWFYEVSPSELYMQTLDNYSQIKLDEFTALQKIATKIQDVNTRTNQLRLSIGESINTLDLKDKENIYRIYDMLEEAVDQFDLMLAQMINLEHQLMLSTKELTGKNDATQNQSIERPFDEIFKSAQKLLLAVKAEDKSQISEQLTKLGSAAKKLQTNPLFPEIEKKQTTAKNLRIRLFENIQEIIEMTKDFQANQPIPDTYDLYGASYYYYNTKLISRFNRYGNGLVTLINQLLANLQPNEIQYLELPHHLKVIYPVKLEQQVPVIASTLQEIVRLPDELEDRKVVLAEKAQEILVDSYETEIEIFDYLHQDGDIISLNFNGDWIIKELSMESKPKKFILKLNSTGENYLILHAVNEGSIPPNTIGINYTHKGRKKRHIMQSSLKTSQMVTIKVDGKS